MKMRLLSIMLPLALAACGDAPAPPPSEPERQESAGVEDSEGRQVLAFGDSLFAGYNVAEDEAYPAQLEAALRERGVAARVVNAGVSGDTTAAGRQRLAFTLDALERPPELVILELGGNDLLRGLSPRETKANLAAMLDELDRRRIPVLLFGMRAPPNLGPEYVADFDALYPALAERDGVELVPFFLEPIYDKPELIQPDRVHPTAEGIARLVAATVDRVAAALPPEE